jgi:hypothetical protein
METTNDLQKFLKGMFGKDEPETQEPPLVMTFGKFYKGDFEGGHRNLYIVWRGKQALYVGISRRNIFNRWFIDPSCHWGNTTIAQVIDGNRPASIRWKIELRHVITDLEKEERRLIHELRPLFNGSHRSPLSANEFRLYKQLSYPQNFTDTPGDRLGLFRE